MTVTEPTITTDHNEGSKPFPARISAEKEAGILADAQTGQFTQRQIAEKFGVSEHTVGRVERDNGIQRRPGGGTRRKVKSFDMDSVEGCKEAIAYYSEQAEQATSRLGRVLEQQLATIQAELAEMERNIQS